jgi:hypothetical protein
LLEWSSTNLLAVDAADAIRARGSRTTWLSKSARGV